jgi:hypothetical protein
MAVGMKKTIFLFAAMLVASLTGLRPSAAQDGIPWLDNYQEALRQAKATGKPIFLEFRCEA